MSQREDLLTPIPSAYVSDERAAIQALAREFAMEEILPVANELDPVQGEIPAELRKRMGELGFFGIMAPEEYGGLGLGVFEYCLVTEELLGSPVSNQVPSGHNVAPHRQVKGKTDILFCKQDSNSKLMIDFFNALEKVLF